MGAKVSCFFMFKHPLSGSAWYAVVAAEGRLTVGLVLDIRGWNPHLRQRGVLGPKGQQV